jgi:2,3-bisphosphoglycerate-independent phosphoglycerate mutase
MVPLLYVGRPATLEDGVLADVIPTLIHLMGFEQPGEMSGRSLAELHSDAARVVPHQRLEAEA